MDLPLVGGRSVADLAVCRGCAEEARGPACCTHPPADPGELLRLSALPAWELKRPPEWASFVGLPSSLSASPSFKVEPSGLEQAEAVGVGRRRRPCLSQPIRVDEVQVEPLAVPGGHQPFCMSAPERLVERGFRPPLIDGRREQVSEDLSHERPAIDRSGVPSSPRDCPSERTIGERMRYLGVAVRGEKLEAPKPQLRRTETTPPREAGLISPRLDRELLR